MFHVVEFSKSSGGGLAIVREEWLTPRKKECFWPPFKHADKFTKCLTSGQDMTDDWNLFPIDRIFYNTDDLLKARKKLKDAESESEIITEEEEYPLKRKRKPCKKFNFSSDKASDDDINLDDVRQLKIPRLSDTPISPVQSNFLSPELRESSFQSEVELHSLNSIISRPSGLLSEASHHTVGTPVSRPLGFFSKASHQESDALDNIARALAKIDRRLSELERNQKEILEKLSPNYSTAFVELPSDIKLPCDSVEDVDKLEEWLLSEENVKALMVNLSILGGKKTPNTVRRILEKLFTNKVAVCYNWTGKHKKRALKDLKITKIIPGTVRRNRNTVDATDDEIYGVMSNWFRFSKDRDGGRHLRAKNCNMTM